MARYFLPVPGCIFALLITCKSPNTTADLNFEEDLGGTLLQQLNQAPVGQLQDINRSRINKTPCTVFAFEGGVATGGHCLISPDRIADIVLSFGERKAIVNKIVVRAFSEVMDYAFLDTTLKVENSFRPSFDSKLPTNLYAVGFPFDPEKAGIVPTNDAEKHEGFLRGSAKRVVALCTEFQNVDESTFSAVCKKEAGKWAGFSGAPLFDPASNVVYGILVGNDATYTYFTKIGQLSAALQSKK